MTFLSASTVEVSEDPSTVASVVLSTAALKVTDSLAVPPSFTSAEPVPASFTVKPLCRLVMFVWLVVTRFVNASAKPTVTVGASSLPPTVTVVSSVVPRYLIILFESFFRLTAFVLVPSATLNFAEILVTAVLPLLIFSTNLVESMPNLIVYFCIGFVFPHKSSVSASVVSRVTVSPLFSSATPNSTTSNVLTALVSSSFSVVNFKSQPSSSSRVLRSSSSIAFIFRKNFCVGER